METYDQILNRVKRGQVVALAPAADGDGNPCLIMVVGQASPQVTRQLWNASQRERSYYALRAVMQLRRRFGII